MKRLNLNNSIATTAMLTKTNAMKNKMNLLYKFSFVVIFACLGFTNIWGWNASPRKEGSVWYSLYDYTNSYSGRNSNDVVINSLDVYPPCDRTDGQLAFSYKNDETVWTTGEADLTVTYRNSGGNTVNTASRNGLKSKNWTSSWFGSVPDNLFSIHVVKTNYSTVGRDFHMKEISVPLARHFRFGSSNEDVGATTKTFGSISQREAVTIGTAKAFAIPIRSFLTATNSAGLKIYASGNTAPFKIKIGGNFVTIDSNGLLFYNKGGNTCAIRNGSGNYSSTPGSSNNYDIEVWYFPTTENGDNLTLTIKDIDSNGNQIGGTETGTINVYAQGVKHTMSFETFVQMPSASQSFTMSNFTGNVSVSTLAPFEVSTDNSNWVKNITVSNNTFYVRFAPTTANADEQIYNEVVTMTSNGTTYNLNVSGKAKKQQATISWDVPQQDLILPLNSIYPLNATLVGDPVTQYSTSDPSVIDIVQNNGVYYIEAKGAAGQRATIKASAGGTDVYTKPADVSYTFTISPKMVQYIKWDQDLSNLKMASDTTPLSVTLTAISCDKGSNEGNVNTVTYSYSTDGIDFIDISGSTMTFSRKGTYYLKAYTTETGGATSGYLSAEMIRTVIVRVDGESCPKFSLMSTNISSGSSHSYGLSGLPETMSGKLKWKRDGISSANVNVSIKSQNNTTLWSDGRGWQWWSTGEADINNNDMSQVSSITVTSNDQDFADYKYIEGLTVTQQTYFNKGGAANNTIPFGDVTVGVSSGVQTFTLNFANVPEIEIVPTSGNTDQFTVTRTNVSSKKQVGGPDVNTVECNCFGNATYSVTFHPTSSGDKRAEYIFKAAIEGADGGYVEFKLTVTGKGTRKSQSLSWDNSHSLFTTSLNALSGTIDLIGAAVSYDGSNPTGLTPTYSLSNVTPAGAVELTDNGTKLKINTYGSFVLNANQSGEGSNYEAAQTLTHEAINISRVTPHLAWVTTPDNSTEVFQMVTVSAATNDTQGEIGNITYSFEPASAGSVTNDGQLTLINREAATLYATISETGTYSAGTIPHTFTPAKVTPVLQCSIQSLERTALTDLYLTEMPVTITNSTTLWHDIAVTYSSNDESIAKLEDDHFSLLKSGTCTISAEVKEGVNNNASSNTIEIPLTVDSASQSITWNDDLTGPYNVGQAAVGPLTATASSGMTVNYSDGGKGIVSIGSDNKISFLKAGYVTITASQSGDERYSAAGNVTKSFKVDFEVGKTFTFTGENVLVDGSKEETFDMTGLFVSSGESYTVTSSSPEFIIENATITSNKITIKFEPKTVENGNDTEEKTSIITITDNGQTYSFKVKATAEKKDAGLTLEYIGETFAFSTITLSHSEATDAEVTLSASIGNIEGNTYQFESTAPVTITATVLANNKFKADSKTLNFTPKAVTPKIINWSGDFTLQNVSDNPYVFTPADWDVDENVGGQPAKGEWPGTEVTIEYSSDKTDIAEVSGNSLVFHRAGVATITAEIKAEKSHNASINKQSRRVKVDFANTPVVCGPAYAGKESATLDITDMIVPVGQLSYSTENDDFSVDFSDNKIVVVYNPTVYVASCTAEITLTDAGNSEVYHLKVCGECDKYTPEIIWKDNKTLQIATSLSMYLEPADLINTTQSQNYTPLTIASSDIDVVKVYDESGNELTAGTPGRYILPVGKGTVNLTAWVGETESNVAFTSEPETFTVSGAAQSRIVWSQNLRFKNDTGTVALTAQVQKLSTSEPITGASITYHLVSNPNNVVSLTNGNSSPLIVHAGTEGTAQIYAEFAGDEDYLECKSETLTIKVVAPASGGKCEPLKLNDVTSNNTIYYFNKNNSSSDTKCFEVEKIEFDYYVKGDDAGGNWVHSTKGADKKIAANFGTQKFEMEAKGGTEDWFTDPAKGEVKDASSKFDAIDGEVPTYISFSGDLNAVNKFENIYVTMKSFFRQNNNFSNPFTGKITMVDETETVHNINLGKYSNLSACEIELWEAEYDRKYEGEEFTIVDDDSDNNPKGCNDYGDLIISIAFKPNSGIPGIQHKCRIKVTYTCGTNGNTYYYTGFLMEGTAGRYDQGDIIWNQDEVLHTLTSLSTKPTGSGWISQNPLQLRAKSALDDIYHVTVEVNYSIDPSSDEGVAEIVDGSKLSIKKAGHVKIIASHPGDRKYEPTSTSRELNIPRSMPAIVLTRGDTPIAENETINVTYNDPSITIGGKAMYGDFEIYGYNVGGKIQLSSSVPDVVAIANGNQLRFLKSGDVTITATITEDDIVFGKTFTFNVHVDKAQAGLHWDDEQKYENDWMYVFDTKKMTALAGNDDNDGTITYEVTDGNARIDADGNITPHNCGIITVKARIAETEKYLADEKTITFKPAKVTPVVTWKNNNVYLTTDKSQGTYTIAENDLATVSAKIQLPVQPSVEKWTDVKEITYSVEEGNEVITLQDGHTFTINKVGYATIKAQVIGGGNNNASEDNPTRNLKVDFDPNKPIYCGEAVVFSSCSKTVNLGDSMAIEGNITANTPNNSEFQANINPNTNELTIIYSPKSIKEPNPTEEIVTIIDSNEVQYKLHVTGKALPYKPIFSVSENKHNNWVFETTPNNAKSVITYGYDNGSDIYWSNADAIGVQEAAAELAKVQLSLNNATDAEYVEIVDNGRNFRVKQAKADSDSDFTVVIVASYPGLEGKMEPSSVEIPITIRKTQYQLDWHNTEVTIYANEQNVKQGKPTLSPSGGVSTVQYSYSKEGVISYDETTDTITLTEEGKKESSVMLIATVASDIYGKGTSASITVTIRKKDQYINWDAIDISDFTTQRDTTLAIDLQAFAQYQDSTKANIFYNVTEVSNCDGEGPLIRIDTIKTTTPYTHKLYYTGNGSGKVTIVATASGTDDFNPVQIGSTDAKTKEINITKEDCYVNGWTVSDMHYGDRVVLEPTVDKSTRGTNYEYTLPPVNGTLDTAGNILNVKGVGNGLTISAKKLEDCWVNESEGSTASNTFNIAKSEQEIEWDKTVLRTPQEGAYHFGVLDGNAYQLATQAIDKLHKDAAATWLLLEGDKYVTANVSGDAPGGLSLVYSIVEQDVCKVGEDKIVSVDNEGKMHITGNGTGTVLVIASVDGRDYYENVSETITVVVDKATPTVAVTGPVGILNYGTGPHTLTASSTVGSYSSANDPNAAFTYKITEGTDVASINNDQLTILKSGTVKVTATQTMNCIVNSATSEEYTITINRADPQLEWKVEPQNATYDPVTNFQNLSVTEISDAAPTFSVTPVSPSTDGATIDQSGVLTITKVGTYKVTVTLVETDKYNSASINKTIVISKADADFFSIADITMTYNDAEISINNDISGGTLTLGTDYQVSYSVGDNGTGFFNVDDANKTINPLKANVDNSGNLVEMTLNASITGMTNYNDKPITGKVYVQRATQEIVWSGIQTPYDTWNDGEEKTVTLDNHTQSQDASHDNKDITPVLTKTYELVISDKGCDIEDASVAYIDNDNVLHITGAASATLTIYAKQNGTDGNGENYTKIEKANNCSTVITINKITPIISFGRSNVNGGADVYYSDPIAYTVSSTATDYSVSDVSAFTFGVTPVDQGAISENKASHAGNVKIKASQAEDCMINGAESGEVNVEIKKAPQHIIWDVEDLGSLSSTSTEGVVLTAIAMNSRWNTPSGMTITYTVCDAQGNDITSNALITIGNDKKVYSAHNGSGEVWVKAVANGNDNYEASEEFILKKITIDKVNPLISWADPCSGQMTMHYRDEKQLTFSCDYTGYTALYTLTVPSDDTYVDITKLAKGNVKIMGVKPNNGTIGIKVTISDPVGNYSNYELNTAITTQKNNTEIDWNGQSFGTYTTADAGTEIVLTAFVKDSYMGDNSEKTVAYDFKSTNEVEGCGKIVELTDEGKLKITGYAAGTVTLYANYAGDENYNASTEKSMQITVGKQTPSFAWADDADIQATYGDEGVTAGEITKDGDGVVTYGSSNETVATIDQDGNITIVGAGTTTISATLAADCQYEAVTTAIEKTLTVNQATGTINWVTGKEPHNDTYSTTLTEEVEATFNNTYDGSIVYSSSNKDVADFENGVLKIYKAGTTTITATRAATRNFTEAKCSTEIVISKAPCTISITSPATITYGQTEIIEYRTTNTDQNVSVIFTSGNANIVSISEDEATGEGVGTTYVYAVIAESDNYLQATSDDFNITVGKAQASFTIDDIALTYGDLDNVVIINNGGITDYTVSFNSDDGEGAYIRINSDNTIDAIGAKCDDQGNIIDIPVTAHFTSTNYEIPDVQFNVTVAKADQTITWEEDKNYTVSNMAGSINLSDYCSGTSGGGTITFSSLDTTVAKVSGNYLVIKKITTLSTVTITATAEGTDNYEKATADTVFTITAEEPTLEISQDYSGKIINLASTKKKVSSVTDDVDFAKLLIDEGILICNYESATYTFVSSDPTVATFNENGMIIVYKKADDLEITVTAHVGEMEASTALHFKIPRGVMEFKNNGNWHDNGKWVRTDMLPSAEDHDVSIQANCIIQDDSTAVCYNLNITDSGSLSVSPNAVLNVTDTITNSEASKLTLKANENHSATVLFATGSPSATVENYIQGGLHSEGEGENRINNPDWQYRGFVGDNPSLSNWNVVIFKWDETKNNGDCWGEKPVYEKSGSYTEGSPWVGYSMANYDTGNPVRDYTSKLIPSDTTMTYNLSYTDHGQQYPNRGVNLITNSWSAPINISDVNFSGDVESTIYFYRTRNYNTWNSNRGAAFETCPIKTANVVANYPMIASSQSFLVRAKGSNASLTINGDSLAHEANGAMYAPAEKERFNVLSITMSVDSMADRVFLLESENCSRAFDNGYDGTKIKEGNMPQIFASNDFGHTAVNTDKTMLGQRIGYSAAEDGALCTITFDTERLDGFSELYLYDRATKRYADILAGDSYSFTGTKAGEEERFEIVGRRDDGSEFVSSSDMMIEVVGNRALLSGFAGGNDEVFITDMNGKRLWTERASNGPWFELPNLPAGVYLINCGEANCKFIVK